MKFTTEQGIHIGKLGGVLYQTNNNKKKHVNNRNLLQEKTTKTTEENEKGIHRTTQKDDEEIRIIRFNGKNKQTFTGPLRRGECDMLPL